MRRHRIHQLVTFLFPVAVYVPGAVALWKTERHCSCAVPCFEIVTQPLTETWHLTATHAGVVGQASLVIAGLIWALFFFDPIIRGRGV